MSLPIAREAPALARAVGLEDPDSPHVGHGKHCKERYPLQDLPGFLQGWIGTDKPRPDKALYDVTDTQTGKYDSEGKKHLIHNLSP